MPRFTYIGEDAGIRNDKKKYSDFVHQPCKFTDKKICLVVTLLVSQLTDAYAN